MTKQNQQAAYCQLQKMYYEICNVYFSHLSHNSAKFQAIQQRKIALEDLLFILDTPEPYASEIEYLAKHHMKLKLPEIKAVMKLDELETQKVIKAYYESLIAQNAAYHDQLLIWQSPNELMDITTIKQTSFNSNYAERTNGYYHALISLGIDPKQLHNLKDVAFNQIWHSSLANNGSNQYDLYFGLDIPQSIKLGKYYRDLRSFNKKS